MPPGALGVARRRASSNIEGYAERRREHGPQADGRRAKPEKSHEPGRTVPAWRTLAATMGVRRDRSRADRHAREYDKRLMLVSGRANPELAAKIADKLGVELGGVDAEDVRQRRGLLPLRGVGARRRRVHRPADLRQRGRGLSDQRRADGAAGDGRRRGRRLRASRDRGDALVRVLPPGQEVRAAGADQRAAGGADARGGGDRPAR